VDFGTSKLMEESGTDPTVTHLRALTPRYASPEQLMGLSVTTAADVYSLGIVLYELLTGTLPREPRPGRPSAAVMFEHDEPIMASALNPTLDREIDSVCMKAIAIDPAERYGSMEAFADDLERWIAGEPVSAHRGSALRHARAWARRRPGLMAATVAGVLLTVGVAVTASVAAVRLAVERRKTLDAERVALRTNQFLVGTIESADERAFAGAELSARALLDDAVRRVNTDAAGDPALAASLHLALGKAYHSLSRTGDAADRFRAALENALTAHGTHHAVTADARMHLASALAAQREFDEALSHARVAADLNIKLDRDVETADSLCVLASIAAQQKDPARALGMLAQAERIRRRKPSGGETPLPAVLEQIAECRLESGDADGAIAQVLEAARVRSELDGPNSRSAAYGQYRVGAAYSLLGRLPEAEDYMRRSLSMARALHGDHNVTLTRQMVGLANVLTAEGRRSEAGVLLEESARLASTSLPLWHYVNIYCRANWAEFLIDQGDFDRAEEELLAAYYGLTDPGNGSCKDPGFVTTQLARLYDKSGRPDEAEKWRARAATNQ
jgi:tetratricopeptide (TPR) repeat protein